MLPEGYRKIKHPALFSFGQKRIVVEHLEIAADMFKRMAGLLGRKGMDAGSGLLILPCSGIHIFFMRFAIDAVFVNKSGNVLKIVNDLRPWGMSFCRGAYGVLELPVGAASAQKLQVGDDLCIVDQDCDCRDK